MVSIAPDGFVVCSACGKQNPPESKFCGACGDALTSSLPRPGDEIAGRYRVVAPIGRGAMGTVYRAEHVQISKVVAIKLLHKELQENPENVTRFHFEAESASRLSHPNTVHVFDFGATKSGALYIVMEYVDGDDLGKLVGRDGPMPFGRVAYLCAQVAGSIADAHEAGILHRDLKPENIVVTKGREGESAKVLDFGLAKLFEGNPETQVTGSGMIVGTPYYMSPEQVQAKPLDARSDVYALGAIMYECVVGKPPFDAPNPVGVLSKHLTQRALPPSSRSPISVPPEADEIIMKCLEKDREHRYESAEALRLALISYLTTVGDEQWRTSGPESLAGSSGTRHVDSLLAPRRRSWWWTLGFVVVATLVVGTWRYIAGGPSEREPNHTEADANRLLEETEVEGYLGRRLDSRTGDVDLFRIAPRGSESSSAVLEVSPIPNMDVMLEVLRPGESDPFIVADSRGLGEGERLPNVPLEDGTYFLRVREKPDGSDHPTENVSDPYYLRWQVRDVDPDFEVEPNDSLEQAEALGLGQERRAWIGWAGDVDTFCLSESAPRVVAQVSALTGVDIVLRVVDRRTERSEKRDASGPGRGETSKTWRNAKAGALCLEISASSNDASSAEAQPDETYGVRFIPGTRP